MWQGCKRKSVTKPLGDPIQGKTKASKSGLKSVVLVQRDRCPPLSKYKQMLKKSKGKSTSKFDVKSTTKM